MFTASATAIGGGTGHALTSDGIIKADVSVLREMAAALKEIGRNVTGDEHDHHQRDVGERML